MTNYNPVVQSIVGMGKGEQAEYVDTRINMDLSSLGKLAEQYSAGYLSGAKFEREMLNAIDKAQRTKRDDQYAALREQRAAEKHQFAINAEERAQAKFNMEMAQKDLASNFARDANTLLRTQEYNDASLAERNAVKLALQDKYIAAGLEPETLNTISSKSFGDVGGKINQLLADKENRQAKADEKAAEEYASIYAPNASLMTAEEKRQLWDNNRTVSTNLQNATRALSEAQAQGINTKMAVENFVKAAGEGSAQAAYLTVAANMTQSGKVQMSETDKESVRTALSNQLVEASGGSLSQAEARGIVNNNTAFFDLSSDFQDRMINSAAKAEYQNLITNVPALRLLDFAGGKSATARTLGDVPEYQIKLWNELAPVLNNSVNGYIQPGASTAPITTTQAVREAWTNIPSTQKQTSAPIITGIATNTNNPPDTQIAAGNVIIENMGDNREKKVKEALQKVVNVVARDTEKTNEVIEDKRVDLLTQEHEVAMGFLDQEYKPWRESSEPNKRAFTEQVQSYVYKDLQLVQESLKEYAISGGVVYDPDTNQLLPTTQLTEPGVLSKLGQGLQQPYKMSLIKEANESLKRLRMYELNEKEGKAFLQDTLKDLGIKTYDKKKDKIESINGVTRLWKSFGGLATSGLSLLRTGVTASKELVEDGKVSEATKLQASQDIKKGLEAGKSLEELGNWAVENITEGALQISDELKKDFTPVHSEIKKEDIREFLKRTNNVPEEEGLGSKFKDLLKTLIKNVSSVEQEQKQEVDKETLEEAKQRLIWFKKAPIGSWRWIRRKITNKDYVENLDPDKEEDVREFMTMF